MKRFSALGTRLTFFGGLSALGSRLSILGFGLGVLMSACSRKVDTTPPTIAPDTGHVAVQGARIFYESSGRGDPIIVVHGGPGMDHSYLLPGMRRLARSNRVIFYDQRGGGRTEGEVSRATVSFDTFLGDISALADSLRLGRFTLMGHSWGGLIALRYAARHPERLRALVLMNSVEPGRRYIVQSSDLLAKKRTTEDSIEYARILKSDALKRREASAVNALLRVTFRTLFTDRALAQQLVIDLDQRTVSNMGPVASMVMTSAGTFDFWTEAASIRVPTLILQGADDAMPLEMVRELARTIPGSRLSIIEGAGHFPYIEKPTDTIGAITRFLAAIPR